MRKWLFFILHLFTTQLILAQTELVFNATEHDFGDVGQTQIPFEHDFIFRNTGFVEVTILSARSINKQLKFIHTKSEVFSGEYGFVKVKLYTDSLTGILHDEVYVTFKTNEEIQSVILYVRANVQANGKTDNERAFQDSEIATSVEVSPEDIENLEGFFGQDKMTQIESELKYLKKQVQLKSDLISQLTEDLQKRKISEAENLSRLKELEETLASPNQLNRDSVLAKITSLSEKLQAIQTADEKMRAQIEEQELLYQSAKQEADSARAYAQDLSLKLQKQFDAEAKAIEKAEQLAADLKIKQQTEAQQKSKIDSLTAVLKENEADQTLAIEIAKLQEELDWKIKEQQLQQDEAKRQELQIEELRTQKELIESYSDSLSQSLAAQEKENEQLHNLLQSTSTRINDYEQKVDSLNRAATIANEKKATEQAAIDSLKQALTKLGEDDEQLKQTLASKNAELDALIQDKTETEKTLKVLEKASSKQVEQANELLNRINSLSTRESQARLESMKLQKELSLSRQREDSTRNAVNNLISSVAEKETSLKNYETSLLEKEQQLKELKQQEDVLKQQLASFNQQSESANRQLDSLQQLANLADTKQAQLQKDIKSLQTEIIESHNEEQELKAYSSALENKLENATLSNEITFEELKAEVDVIATERDDFKQKLIDAEARISEIENQLELEKKRANNAEAFAKEFGYSTETKK